MRASLAAFAFALLVASDSFAHGGGWRPPPPNGPPTTPPNQPPGGGGTTGKNPGRPGRPKTPKQGPPPSTTPPPGAPTTPPSTPPDSPTTPPPTAPTSPPSTVPPSKPTTPPPPPPNVPSGGPSTTPSSPPSTPRGPGRGVTGGPTAGRRAAATDSDRWETWWAHTRELYLGRHAAASLLSETPDHGFQTGRASAASGGSPLLPETIRRELLPVLARALRDGSSEVADSAAIALGRSVHAPDAGPILPLLLKNLGHAQRSPREAAVVGLGVLGGREAVDPLRKIALDQPEGRALVGAGGPIDEMLRGLAALSLGVVGSQEVLSPLVTLATSHDTSRELAAAAVVGLGLQREAAPAAAIALARLLDERSLDRTVRAQVPIALSRLPASSSRGTLPKLLQILADRRTSDEIARSAVLAIGRIAIPDDDEAVKALMDVGRRGDDAPTRQFALLALGRVFERNAASEADAARLRETVQSFLIDQLRNPTHRTQRPWAALALGLHGRGDATFATAAPSPSLVLAGRKMIETFEDENDPSLQGALAVALGLMRSPAAPAVLRARLQETSHPALRGHLAIALGLLRDGAAIEPLRALLEDPSLPPATRIDVARGLALTGDAGFEGRLLDLLAQASDLPSAVAYAKALGLVGSRNAAEPLRRMAEDSRLPEIQRAFAVVAIGLLAEKTPLPWNVPLVVDANYTVPLRPLEEVLDLL